MATPRVQFDSETRERLLELWECTGDEGLRRVADGRPYLEAAATAAQVGGSPDSEPLRPELRPEELNPEELLDWARTGLMNAFRVSGEPQAFELLYELSADSFMAAIRGRLRGQRQRVDAHDVLQEVFLNIYRYPHRFTADRADAFRNWGHRIVRNTLLKLLEGAARAARVATFDDEFSDQPDVSARSPFRSACDAEVAKVADRAFLLWLNLYLLHFQKLSPREQRALRLVECEGRPYKIAAADLGIRLENLKMVVFRGRQKILRGMSRSLGRLREHFEGLDAGPGPGPGPASGRSESACHDPVVPCPPPRELRSASSPPARNPRPIPPSHPHSSPVSLP